MSRREFAKIFFREALFGTDLRTGTTIVLLGFALAAALLGLAIFIAGSLGLPYWAGIIFLVVAVLLVEPVAVCIDAWQTAKEEV